MGIANFMIRKRSTESTSWCDFRSGRLVPRLPNPNRRFRTTVQDLGDELDQQVHTDETSGRNRLEYENFEHRAGWGTRFRFQYWRVAHAHTAYIGSLLRPFCLDGDK